MHVFQRHSQAQNRSSIMHGEETTGQGSLICAMQELGLEDHSIPCCL